ncbi:MAG: hypothetical protein P4L43_09785 [Syntrophobacteraceae bacterium]|nr:hypothetical protein [Syntrophobacteraceae bacterium]
MTAIIIIIDIPRATSHRLQRTIHLSSVKIQPERLYNTIKALYIVKNLQTIAVSAKE